MNNKPKNFHSLSRRIVAQFCIFTLVLSVIFSFLTFILLYNLEDNFIERDVSQEANYLVSHYQQYKVWPAPRSKYFSLHFSKQSLPDDMRAQFIEEPRRKEFYGEQGRHYHLYSLPQLSELSTQEIYLLAEVSDKLLVRPVRDGVLVLLLVSASILTFFAFIIAWLLGRKTAKPLKALADLVDGVAPEHIPKTFAGKFPNNEIGVLARTLENSMEQISKALERERCFTRDVSHELRTPVAIIQNAAELRLQQIKSQASIKQGDDEGEVVIHRILDASRQMEQTVTTLLHLAREEHATAQKSSVKLLPLIEQSIIERSYMLDGKSVEVEVSDNCHANVLAQQGMLKVLLDNLISNAFQYTDSGLVSVSFDNNTLTIADTGPGIEADISPKITEPTVKGSQSTGYGFGLSIVKRLCEHQGWQLTVVSHQGTKISVVLS